MTTGKDTMGEQPIFTCKAHVFHIDPKTKRSWLQVSDSAVDVSFFYDSTRSFYRIISVEGHKAMVNSTITTNMTFTKTSQKFGQWSDTRANTVYGLGFTCEAELQKFIVKFNELKEATKTSAISKVNGANSAITPVTSANASPITGRSASVQSEQSMLPVDSNVLEPPVSTLNFISATTKSEGDGCYTRSHSLGSANIPNDSPSHQFRNEKNIYGTSSSSPSTVTMAQVSAAVTTTNSNSANSNDMQQLKYENDRLKMALAQSSANAKKWEIELSTLKSNNTRLTSALQESTANVDEWKRQLASLKEENARMRIHADSDSNKVGSDALVEELRKEITTLKIRIDQLEKELEVKNSKCKQLLMAQMKYEEIQLVLKENQELHTTAKLAQSELEIAMSAHDSQRKVLLTLAEQLASRVHELATIHDELTTALQT